MIQAFSHYLIGIDECLLRLDACVKNANCLDTEGSYECICSSGYSGDGLVNCESESLQMHPRCQHTNTSMISVRIQAHAKATSCDLVVSFSQTSMSVLRIPTCAMT